MDVLVVALFLALVSNRVVAGLVAPVRQKWPELDMWWLIYVSWVIGGLLGWLAEVNLFAAYLPNELAGRVLSAVVIGGGANMIYDIWGQKTNKIEIMSGSVNGKG
jgi:hypothetical protein